VEKDWFSLQKSLGWLALNFREENVTQLPKHCAIRKSETKELGLQQTQLCGRRRRVRPKFQFPGEFEPRQQRESHFIKLVPEMT
jgi:hypothetical protein